MDSYVVKIQNKGTIRRLTLAPNEKQFSYEQLRKRIGNLFQLPSAAEFVVTYTDKDGDVVTMAEDEDLKDALVVQRLNPLRVAIENLQVGTDSVKVSSPLVEDELTSEEVTEQQQQQQSIQGEEIPQTLSNPGQVDPVASPEPVLNSGENSAAPQEDVARTANGASDESVPASAAPLDAAKEDSAEEAKATGNKFSVRMELRRHDRGPGGPQIHSGIRCDSCGMLPIEGPRFKSSVKPNYDLCLKCFEASGAGENEYTQIDRVFYRIGHPAYVGRMRERLRAREAMCRKPDQCQNSSPDTAEKNSTGVAPAEAENKTAPQENSKSVVHPGVQCDDCGKLPIEGLRYKSSTRFDYDLCQTCFEKSGSNASEYSRIDQPIVIRRGHPLVMGQLRPPFLRNYPGRWVWAMNQIVPIIAVDKAEAGEKKPAAGTEQAGAEGTLPAGSDVKVGENVVTLPQTESAASENTSSETSAPKVDGDSTPSVAKQEDETTTREADLGTNSAAETQTAVDVEQSAPSVDNDTLKNAGKTAGVEEEIVQAPAVPADGKAAGVEEETVQETAVPVDGDLSTKEGLLAKLASMGFGDVKLNEELLEKNNFDLRRTLDDLCAAEEWDPILGELQEMGFYDANMNRRLMFKNNGSVKRVVKELVQMYKGEKLA